MNARNHIRISIDVDENGIQILKDLANQNKWQIVGHADYSEPVTNLDVIINNLLELKNEYEEYEQEIKEDEYGPWWEDEFGSDRTWQINCHPVFADSAPCLNDKRGVPYPSGNTWKECEEWNRNCSECKALWLMEEYE